jgi:hypothetical protein
VDHKIVVVVVVQKNDDDKKLNHLLNQIHHLNEKDFIGFFF